MSSVIRGGGPCISISGSSVKRFAYFCTWRSSDDEPSCTNSLIRPGQFHGHSPTQPLAMTCIPNSPFRMRSRRLLVNCEISCDWRLIISRSPHLLSYSYGIFALIFFPFALSCLGVALSLLVHFCSKGLFALVVPLIFLSRFPCDCSSGCHVVLILVVLVFLSS